MRRSIYRSVMVLAGLLVLFSAQARQARAESESRETIIQGVRDDVRRKIQESSEKPAEKSEELASRTKQQQPAAPEPAGQKQEPAK
jgi:cytoskeletal protein RodZ